MYHIEVHCHIDCEHYEAPRIMHSTSDPVEAIRLAASHNDNDHFTRILEA